MSEQEQKQTEDFNEVLEKVEEESSKEVSSDENLQEFKSSHGAVSYTHLRAHET